MSAVSVPFNANAITHDDEADAAVEDIMAFDLFYIGSHPLAKVATDADEMKEAAAAALDRCFEDPKYDDEITDGGGGCCGGRKYFSQYAKEDQVVLIVSPSSLRTVTPADDAELSSCQIADVAHCVDISDSDDLEVLAVVITNPKLDTVVCQLYYVPPSPAAELGWPAVDSGTVSAAVTLSKAKAAKRLVIIFFV